MKYQPSMVSLLFIIIACTTILQAGDAPQTTTTTTTGTTSTTTAATVLSFDQIIDKINGMINSRHSRDFFFYVFDPQLSEKDMVIIIGTLAPYCTDEKITEKLFQTLSKKNSLFKQLYDYCISKAVKNVDDVTCDTLAIVENPEADQPQPFLNQLQPLVLKKYIITKALETVNPTYTMRLIGHTDSIRYADICIATGHAVTSSLDNSIRFWDLNNGGKCVAAFQSETACVCFNKTGSRFATVQKANASDNQQECTVIKQWKIKAPNFQPLLTHSTETIPLVSYMAYCNNNTLVVIGDKYKPENSWDTHFCQTILTFGKKNTVSTLGTVYLTVPESDKINNWKYLDTTPYTTRNDGDNKAIVTKESCPLYFCKQAIKNSSPTTESQTQVKNSRSYQQLTPYEKEMILQQITAKAAPLQEQKSIKQ